MQDLRLLLCINVSHSCGMFPKWGPLGLETFEIDEGIELEAKNYAVEDYEIYFIQHQNVN